MEDKPHLKSSSQSKVDKILHIIQLFKTAAQDIDVIWARWRFSLIFDIKTKLLCEDVKKQVKADKQNKCTREHRGFDYYLPSLDVKSWFKNE